MELGLLEHDEREAKKGLWADPHPVGALVGVAEELKRLRGETGFTRQQADLAVDRIRLKDAGLFLKPADVFHDELDITR
jgi:hypothetical protein